MASKNTFEMVKISKAESIFSAPLKRKHTTDINKYKLNFTHYTYEEELMEP